MEPTFQERFRGTTMKEMTTESVKAYVLGRAVAKFDYIEEEPMSEAMLQEFSVHPGTLKTVIPQYIETNMNEATARIIAKSFYSRYIANADIPENYSEAETEAFQAGFIADHYEGLFPYDDWEEASGDTPFEIPLKEETAPVEESMQHLIDERARYLN